VAPSLAAAQGLVLRLPGLGPTAFTVTNTSIVRYRAQNFDLNPSDDDFFSLTERLDLAAQAAPWRLYTRVDAFVPWNHDTSCPDRDDPSSNCYLRWNLRPERISLRYQRGDITVEAGDFYQVFGRALSLAFRKVDPIGLDTVLRGARAEYDHGRLNVRAFAGLANPQNLDPVSLGVYPDPEDALAGGALTARLGEDSDIELSGHVVHASFERGASDARQDSIDIAGSRIEFPSLFDGDLTLYGEANVLRRTTRFGVASDDTWYDPSTQTGPTRNRYGRGIYAAAQLIRDRWTFLVEWKDYTSYILSPSQLGGATPRDVARIYGSAPSLERDDQRIFTNANTRGARVRVDYAFQPSPWIVTFNSVLYGWSDAANESGDLYDPWDSTQGYLTTHTYVAVRRRSRPVITPQAPAAGGAGANDPNTRAQGGAATQGAGGANINAGGGLSGASVTRVGRGDFNLIASVGYRREFHAGTAHVEGGMSEPEFRAGDVKHESVQADFDIAFPVGANDSLELRIDNRFERNFLFDRITGFDLSQLLSGVRGGVSLSWSHGLPLVVSATLRWDNTTRSPGTASLFDLPLGRTPQLPSGTSPGVEARQPTLFPSAEVRWNFTISNFVRVFAGMTPGGRVCSGGVCRDVPLFQGAIAELVLRF
jgi:hypothetical protein